MRRTTSWTRVSVLAGVCLAVLASGCYTPRPINARPTWPDAQASALGSAGDRLGVPVDTETVLSVSQGGATLSTAAARSWRTTPATELPRGVNFAVAWLDAADNQPAGYYTLRAVAQPRGVGQVDGTIQVVNAAGSVAREVPATFDITSMTLPENAARIPTTITIEPIRHGPTCTDSEGRTCYCCTNGVLICSDRLFRPIRPHIVSAIP